MANCTLHVTYTSFQNVLLNVSCVSDVASKKNLLQYLLQPNCRGAIIKCDAVGVFSIALAGVVY